MTISKKKKDYILVSLLFETKNSYDTNLDTLLALIEKTQYNSCIVAPEVCLTGFDYDNLSAAQDFTPKALKSLKEVSQNKIIILTMIEKVAHKTFNMLKVIHNGKVVYSRAKEKLFKFAAEEKYFTPATDADFEIVEIDGIKIAVLICFELRFKDMWKKCEGADVIATPSWWGVARSEHFVSFTKTLAIMNQCYVVASDSLNAECSKMSSIINPQGKALYNGNKACLEVQYNEKEIAIMRRYMDVGLGKDIG
ncbi:MAG: carbon-nitrogen hydrolase family protein [Sulfurimonas sp.]|nr:carbon-nitrogen hydrolase family protein [Sulfurimonas sp.]MDQ7060593.1 carbon-nitrogen hydrolase family protein [Sulfurimonas sp.]